MRRFFHRFDGGERSSTGPVEFAWDDGTFSTIDVGSDWVITVASRAWIDPFANASDVERQQLAIDVGLWEVEPSPRALMPVVGHILTGVEGVRNEVGLVDEVRIMFADVVVVAEVDDGDLAVTIH
ncbi:hypothetical protein PX701_09795 [Agromyces sp. H3Y2-19a]|nr:hypothetical protein [Agromyces chromiiresistens]